MTRYRTRDESITEPGQEMQDCEDLQAGRLEDESSVRSDLTTPLRETATEVLASLMEARLHTSPELAAKQRRLLEVLSDESRRTAMAEMPSSQEEMVVATPDLIEASRRMGELLRSQAPSSDATASMPSGIDATEAWLRGRTNKTT